MTVPSERDINPGDSPDEISAAKHFLGKTVEEAEELFRENSFTYQEDLMWMGPRAFHYYIQSAINYVKSEHAAGDDQFIDCLHMIVRFRSEDEGLQSLATDAVLDLIDYVIDNYDKFDVDAGVFGDVREKFRTLKSELLSARGGGP
jgi:hypothetical protein